MPYLCIKSLEISYLCEINRCQTSKLGKTLWLSFVKKQSGTFFQPTKRKNQEHQVKYARCQRSYDWLGRLKFNYGRKFLVELLSSSR